jgi:membrane-bound serine protease (ClpP class)
MLLMIGLLLILFEFYSAGIGVAGVTGAFALILACYGLAALGPNPVALVLIGLALFGFAVDVQAGVPRTWTAIGTVALALGSWLLFPGDRRVGWPALVIVLAGTLLFVLRGMTVMVRSRFSTPVIRRDAMVGREGAVATALDPDGLVDLGGGRWRARTTRAGSSMGIGAPVRVVAVDGLVLEVEPAPAARAAPPAVGSQGD